MNMFGKILPMTALLSFLPFTEDQSVAHLALIPTHAIETNSQEPIHLYYLNGTMLEHYRCPAMTIHPSPNSCTLSKPLSVPVEILFEYLTNRISTPIKETEEKIAKLGREIELTDIKINDLLMTLEQAPNENDGLTKVLQQSILEIDDQISVQMLHLHNLEQKKSVLEQQLINNPSESLRADLSQTTRDIANANLHRDELLTKLMAVKTNLITHSSSKANVTTISLLRQQRQLLVKLYQSLLDQSKSTWDQLAKVIHFNTTVISDKTFTYLLSRDQFRLEFYPYEDLNGFFKDYFEAYILFQQQIPATQQGSSNRNDTACNSDKYVKIPGDYGTIQEGIDAIRSIGGTVCLEEGTFYLEKALYIETPSTPDSASINLIGQGRNKTIIKQKDRNSFDLAVKYSEFGGNVQVQNISFEGSIRLVKGDAKSSFASIGSDISNFQGSDADYNVPRDIFIFANRIKSLSIAGAKNTDPFGNTVRIINSVINGYGATIRGGLDPTTPTSLWFQNNTVFSNKSTVGAVEIASIQTLNVSNNLFVNNKTALFGRSLGDVQQFGNVFSNNEQNYGLEFKPATTDIRQTDAIQFSDDIPLPAVGSPLCKSNFKYNSMHNVDFLGAPRDLENPTVGAIECMH